MKKVIVVKQERIYCAGVIKHKEIEVETVDLADKIRIPYEVLKPKSGYPYKVVNATVVIRDVHEITQPLDDYPPEAP